VVSVLGACVEPTRIKNPPAMEKVEVPTSSAPTADEPTSDAPIGDAGPVGAGPTKLGGTGPEVPSTTDAGDAPATTSPSATKVAQVLLGPPQVSGKLGADVIDRTVHARLPRLKACYEVSLKHTSTLEGALSMSFVVTKTGGVRSPSAAGGTLSDKPLTDCVGRQLAQLVFPRPKAETTVVLPLTFVAPAHP